MTIPLQRQQPPHEQSFCMPVGEEFGTPPDKDLLLDPDMRSVIADIGDQLAATHAITGNELENGEAAARALKGLGCCACKLSGTCTVENILEEKVAVGKENAAFMEKATMIASAPKWLTAARLQDYGKSPAWFTELLEDPDNLADALETGEFDIDTFLGKSRNTFEGLHTKKDIPEIARIATANSDTQLETHKITADNGNAFLVTDASEAIPFKDDTLTPQEYGVLASKFAERLLSNDSTGKPHAFTADNKMQKVIGSYGDSKLFEIRMGGKPRFYFTVHETPSQETAANIVILGAHGDSEQAQRRFIDILK